MYIIVHEDDSDLFWDEEEGGWTHHKADATRYDEDERDENEHAPGKIGGRWEYAR